MSNTMLQIIVLGAIAVFLIMRLRNVLGTREGFERPPQPIQASRPTPVAAPAPEESDVLDHAEPGTPAAEALTAMQRAEPSFAVGPFLAGARQAYEMILTAFERGDLSEVRPFLAPQVAEAFEGVIQQRQAQGIRTEVQYLGTRETGLQGASFDPQSGTGEISVRFVGELIAVHRDAAGNVVEGDPKAARKQRDVWTFARRMGQDDPNWQLVATA
ncbi:MULTISPECIES: Tim44/TimA family putative adaptor protein [unclassified Paracoccus (in: a-proteobacteria)]|uniref:Tim44/TimA family putative adaptor protein n=1 Tax=unclassified Paracoccus (in: a-proteobacteria) TaxID=2688777 RepID=UPI001600342C|nr:MULTISPECIES: Tim44/TimA family putative adaptor protein [unclassified Paracoccus (in: a-proteobacteria)]MBB1492084.1 Tim44 domain-containing protein [Paracoccus sp. MC1854]MBB1497970.1 Tim44 domain-containing protein [Paracoccus sp. MC1862]QQO44354.1 Tim44 domain-containing protein [Paracoccus sp. MC1862]